MEPSRGECEAEVVALIRSITGTSKEINSETDLARDLGVDGADAADLLEVFAERFQVDMLQFVFSDYFGPEASANPLGLVRWMFGLKTRHPKRGISVAKLSEVAKRARWER